MSRVILPPGKKPLPVIRRVSDPVDRIEDYAKLLEWLLVIHVAGPTEGEDLGYLGEHVQRHADKFSNIRFVNAAIGVYNDIKHAKPVKDRPPPTEAQIEGAAGNLEKAVLEILPYAPESVRRAVNRDPRFGGIPSGVVLAAAVLFGLAMLVFLVVKIDNNGKSARRVSSKDENPEVQLRDAKQAQNRADKLASDADAALDELEQAQTRWDGFTSKLLTNDAGRRLAQSDEALRATAGLLARPRIRAGELKTMRSTVASTIKPIRDALKDERADLYPQEHAFHEIELIRGRAFEAIRGCKDDTDRVGTMLARLQVAAPGTKTLQQAIDEFRETDRLAKIAAERKAADEVSLRLAEKAQTAEARKQAYQTKLVTDRAEYRRLRALAEDPVIREKFSPFLGQGVRFPRVNTKSVSWQNESGRTSGPPGPIGYDWLVSARVLASAEAMIAVATSDKNDRGAWPAATTDAELKEYRERFDLLKALAPMWHDMGLLGPQPEQPHLPDPAVLAESLKRFQGEWRDRKEDYDFYIVGAVGITTRSGKLANPVGGEMIRIEDVNADSFHGRHYLQGGTWARFTGKVISLDRIQITTEFGRSWITERLPTGK